MAADDDVSGAPSAGGGVGDGFDSTLPIVVKDFTPGLLGQNVNPLHCPSQGHPYSTLPPSEHQALSRHRRSYYGDIYGGEEYSALSRHICLISRSDSISGLWSASDAMLIEVYP